METASSANSNTSGFVWNPEDGELEVLGPLTPEHMEMFLRNPRFLGIQALTWREWGDIRSNCFGRCKVKEIILDFHSLLWTSFNTCFHALLQHLWDLWWQSQTLKDLKRFRVCEKLCRAVLFAGSFRMWAGQRRWRSAICDECWRHRCNFSRCGRGPCAGRSFRCF